MRKNIFKTIMLSVLIAAVLATGMTSFAATVSTTTTYNPKSANVQVSTTVTDVEVGSMVAYMVTKDTTGAVTESDVLYLNQKTADSTGVLNFNYEIDKTKLTNTSNSTLATQVKFGSNVSQEFNSANDSTSNDYAAELGLLNIDETADGGVNSISYFTDATCEHSAAGTTGFGETVYARVNLASGYELKTVTVDGEGATINGNVFPVKRSINVTTSATASPVGIVATQRITATYTVKGEDPINGYGYMIKKRGGDLEEVGIEYGGYLYPALLTTTDDHDNHLDRLDGSNDGDQSDICVVVLIFGGSKDSNNLNTLPGDVFASMTPYYKVNGTYYTENDDFLGEMAPLYGSMAVPVPELSEGLKIPKKADLAIEEIDDPSEDIDEEVSEPSNESVEEDSVTLSEIEDVEDSSDITPNDVNE